MSPVKSKFGLRPSQYLTAIREVVNKHVSGLPTRFGVIDGKEYGTFLVSCVNHSGELAPCPFGDDANLAMYIVRDVEYSKFKSSLDSLGCKQESLTTSLGAEYVMFADSCEGAKELVNELINRARYT